MRRASSAAVGAVIVTGIAVAGTPGAHRVRKFDTRRTEDVRLIYGEVMTIGFGRTTRNPAGRPCVEFETPSSVR